MSGAVRPRRTTGGCGWRWTRPGWPLRRGDVPVGAVVVGPDGADLGRGRNVREASGDPTGARRDAARCGRRPPALGDVAAGGCTLVVTLEPCTMCAGALVLARVDRLVFGAGDPKAGAVGSLWDVVRDRRLNHRPEVVGGRAGRRVRRAAGGVLRQAASVTVPVAGRSAHAVACPSGLRSTPRKRVTVQPVRGFKSHRHRPPSATSLQVRPCWGVAAWSSGPSGRRDSHGRMRCRPASRRRQRRTIDEASAAAARRTVRDRTVRRLDEECDERAARSCA